MDVPAWAAAPCSDRHWPSRCQGLGMLYIGQAASAREVRLRLTTGILRGSYLDSNPRKNSGIRFLLGCAFSILAAWDLHSGDVITSAGIYSDRCALFNKGGNLDFESSFGNNFLGQSSRCIAAHGHFRLCHQQVDCNG
jgi:hypothetical protein